MSFKINRNDWVYQKAENIVNNTISQNISSEVLKPTTVNDLTGSIMDYIIDPNAQNNNPFTRADKHIEEMISSAISRSTEIQGKIGNKPSFGLDNQNSISECKQELEQTTNTYNDTQTKVDNITTRVDDQESVVNNAQTSVNTQQSTVNTNQNNVNSAQNIVNNSQETVNTNQTSVNNANNKVSTATSNVKSAQNTVTEKFNTVSDAQAELQAAQSAAASIQSSSSSGQTKGSSNGQSSSQATQAQQRVEEAQNKLEEAQSEYKKAQEALNTKQETLTDAQNTLEEAQNTLSESEETLEEDQSELKTAQETFTDSQEKLETCQNTLETENKTLQTNRNTLEIAQNDLKIAQKSVTNAKQQVDEAKEVEQNESETEKSDDQSPNISANELGRKLCLDIHENELYEEFTDSFERAMLLSQAKISAKDGISQTSFAQDVNNITPDNVNDTISAYTNTAGGNLITDIRNSNMEESVKNDAINHISNSIKASVEEHAQSADGVELGNNLWNEMHSDNGENFNLQAYIENINEDNVSDTIASYNANSYINGGENLIGDIYNTKLTMQEKNDAVMHMYNTLNNKAQTVGMETTQLYNETQNSIQTMERAINTFKNTNLNASSDDLDEKTDKYLELIERGQKMNDAIDAKLATLTKEQKAEISKYDANGKVDQNAQQMTGNCWAHGGTDSYTTIPRGQEEINNHVITKDGVTAVYLAAAEEQGLGENGSGIYTYTNSEINENMERQSVGDSDVTAIMLATEQYLKDTGNTSDDPMDGNYLTAMYDILEGEKFANYKEEGIDPSEDGYNYLKQLSSNKSGIAVCAFNDTEELSSDTYLDRREQNPNALVSGHCYSIQRVEDDHIYLEESNTPGVEIPVDKDYFLQNLYDIGINNFETTNLTLRQKILLLGIVHRNPETSHY